MGTWIQIIPDEQKHISISLNGCFLLVGYITELLAWLDTMWLPYHEVPYVVTLLDKQNVLDILCG